MVLEILLAAQTFGISYFLLRRFFAPKNQVPPLQPQGNPNNSRKRLLIKEDLDHLLMLYRQGNLSEEQYARLTDQLIDQMLVSENPAPIGDSSLMHTS